MLCIELKMLCIRAKNALHYVVQGFMWRSPRDARKDASSRSTHALIRITDGYLAEIGHLQVGGCKQFELQDFKTNSWKKMPPPNTTVL